MQAISVRDSGCVRIDFYHALLWLSDRLSAMSCSVSVNLGAGEWGGVAFSHVMLWVSMLLVVEGLAESHVMLCLPWFWAGFQPCYALALTDSGCWKIG